ncbi:MAG: serpin family protein [Myxococcota bacterium]
MRSVILLMAVLAGCDADEPNPASSGEPDDKGGSTCVPSDVVASEGARSAAGSSDAFGWDLYQSLAESEEGNLFFSPFSITAALSMTYAGAAGGTAEEMATVLHVQGEDAAYHQGYGDLLDVIVAEQEGCAVQLNLANRLFGQTDFPWLDPFLDITATDYNAPLEEIDFIADPGAAQDDINGWVGDQTADRITDLIPDGVINSYTRLVLANAIYFKADWLNQFDEEQTFDSDFALEDGSTVEVPMMFREGAARLGNVEGAQALELPYDGEMQSMILLLPEYDQDLSDLEARLDNDFIDGVVQSLSEIEDAVVMMPRFTIDARVPLKAQLIALGMPSAFDNTVADLTKMASREDANLFIQDALHRAFIEVNEAGSEAAAATAVVVGDESAPPGFYAQRPFVFLIRDNATGTVLFLGRVVDPSE